MGNTTVQELVQQNVKVLIGELQIQNIALNAELVEARKQIAELRHEVEVVKVNGQRPPAGFDEDGVRNG